MEISCYFADFVNNIITFTNERTVIESDGSVTPARTEQSTVLDGTGHGTVDLPVWPAGGAAYQVRVAGRYDLGSIIVSAGGPTDLATLLDEAGIDLPTVSVLEARVAALEEAVTGAGIADRTYRHVQSSAASVWTIPHNLGKYPAVSVVDSTRRVVYGQIDYLDSNTITVTFSAAFAGEAYAN